MAIDVFDVPGGGPIGGGPIGGAPDGGGTPVTPISASDTIAVVLADAASITVQASIAAASTVPVALSETAIITVAATIAASSSVPVALSETAAVEATLFKTGTDSVPVLLSEAAAITLAALQSTASRIRISLDNFVETATITASTEDAEYPATNIRSPQRPTKGARTTGVTANWWVLDFGSARTFDVVALIDTNFTSVRIQANSADSWAAPAYDSGLLTVGQNPGHGRYHLFHHSGALTFRYVRIRVPAQTPVTGVGYFRLGGVHVGLNVVPREDVLMDYDLHTVEPRLSGEVGRTTLSTGPSYTRLTVRRRSPLGPVPGSDDDYEDWQEIEWAWAEADYALVTIRDEVSSWCWIMRRLAPPGWALTSKVGEADLQLEEVLR